jgi:hypothetical protein
MRTDAEIKSIIEGAFNPLRCVAEVWDYGKKFRFRVFGPDDKPLIRFEKLNMRDARSDSNLSLILAGVRDRIEENGHRLDTWKFP